MTTGHLDVSGSGGRYLRERIQAKQRVGWEYRYDEREREALAWAIEQLVKAGLVG
jgi:hypothetical protein